MRCIPHVSDEGGCGFARASVGNGGALPLQLVADVSRVQLEEGVEVVEEGDHSDGGGQVKET